MTDKILVVDDEEDIREILQFNLEDAGYEVVCAESGEEALEIVDDSVSLILLDVMMSGMSGFNVVEILRKERHDDVPVIFLTAKGDENSLITGFCTGADDYISKPFSIQEVLVRIKAVLRRRPVQKRSSNKVITLDDMVIDLAKKKVTMEGVPVQLPKKEFEILWLLASHPDKIFSREDIITEVWKDAPYVIDRTVDVHIAKLRSLLGDNKRHITNRSGYGYTFSTDEE